MSQHADRSDLPRPTPGVIQPAFEELLPTLDTGDILLFGGSSPLSSWIKRLTRSRWSHVALVARAPTTRRLLLWEATLDTDLPDVATSLLAPGVNLYDLHEWVSHYADETAVRQLQIPRTVEMTRQLLDFYLEARGRPYERNRLQLLGALYDGPGGRNRQPDTSSFFCSELVAEAYQRLGLLPLVPPSSEYTPRDFSTERRAVLPLQQGASLGPELLLCSAAQFPEDNRG
ncbi:MAG: YiiX/YebB-like N1pC/P60 family cysteine hydrolase [Gemmataceae bacterium]